MGEEEATMREKLIEAMARAISRTNGWPQDMWDNPEKYSTSRVAKEAYVAFSTTALDALLERVKDVEMDTLRAGYEAMFVDKWDGTQAPMMGAGWDAMLATLRSPKI